MLAYAAAVPFMNTSLFTGPVAEAWHGADIAYFVNFLVAALLYGGYRLLGGRPANLDKYKPGGLIATPFIQPDGVGVACQRTENQVVDAALVQMRPRAAREGVSPAHFRGIREAH